MAHYFFDVHDGLDLPDHTGVDLPDLTAAKVEAVRLAGVILMEQAKKAGRGEAWRVEVRDHGGKVRVTVASTLEWPEEEVP